MFANQSGVVPAIGTTGRAVAKTGTKWSLAILISCGVLHATPIVNSDAWRPQSPKQLSIGAVVPGTKQATAGLEPVAMPSSPSASDVLPLMTYGCVFAANCSNPVEVPEPQSLALLGTGLLSLAGIIRRRTSR